MDVEEHDKTYQQQKFRLRYDVIQNVDILSFDISYFPYPKTTKSKFSSSKNDFYEVEYVNYCHKYYIEKLMIIFS